MEHNEIEMSQKELDELVSQEREKLIKLAIENRILCSEEVAKKNNCHTCLNFYKAIKQGKSPEEA